MISSHSYFSPNPILFHLPFVPNSVPPPFMHKLPPILFHHNMYLIHSPPQSISLLFLPNSSPPHIPLYSPRYTTTMSTCMSWPPITSRLCRISRVMYYPWNLVNCIQFRRLSNNLVLVRRRCCLFKILTRCFIAIFEVNSVLEIMDFAGRERCCG